MYTQTKLYHPYISPFDPCPPIRVKSYDTPANLYLGYQPPNLPQYPAHVALYKGTLWPTLYSEYRGRMERGDRT